MREWKVTDGYKVKADELSWEELKNATENVIEEKRKSHRIVVLDGYGLNPGDLSWEGIEEWVNSPFMTVPLLTKSYRGLLWPTSFSQTRLH